MTSTNQAQRPGSALSPLRVPVFRAIWIASCITNFGTVIQHVAASWTMTSIAPSPTMVALVNTSVTLPIMLLALLTGALADNYDRRHILLGAQGFMLAVSIAMSICAALSLLSPWLLLLFTFLIGCGMAFNQPAWQASVADMVPRSEISSAVALNATGFNVARSFGPAIGGTILAFAGPAIAFVVTAISYVALIVALLRWHPVLPQSTLPRETLGGAIAAGLRYVAMSPKLLTILLRGAVFGIGFSAIYSLLPLIARNMEGGDAVIFGILLGSFGIGAVIGGFATAYLRAAIGPESIVRLGCTAFALCTVVVAESPDLVVTVIALLVAGANWVMTLATLNATVQLNSPRWVVARVLSMYQMAVFGGMALGSWSWGLLTEAADVRTALFTAAVTLLLCAILGFRLPIPRTDGINLDPFRSWQEPVLAIPVESRSGPIVISIEYHIHVEDRMAFLRAMSERRRIRRRDGGRRWSLTRDLADEQQWIERYQTPTWLDYIRQSTRVTQDDAEIAKQVLALHRGTLPPIVTRLIEEQVGPSSALQDRNPENFVHDPSPPVC